MAQTFLACPIDFALSLLVNKWTIPILRDLAMGTKRTSELLRSLVGISPRTLSERLRELDELGLISRRVYAEIPPRVEYCLTDLGKDVGGLLAELQTLGELWQNKMGIADSASTSFCTHCQQEKSAYTCPAINGMNNDGLNMAPASERLSKSATRRQAPRKN